MDGLRGRLGKNEIPTRCAMCTAFQCKNTAWSHAGFLCGNNRHATHKHKTEMMKGSKLDLDTWTFVRNTWPQDQVLKRVLHTGTIS